VTETSARTCTLSVVVPTGSDDFTTTLYDAAPANGVIPVTAHVLGTATVTQTVSATAPTTVSLFVQGVIAGFGTIMPLITFPGDGNIYTQSMMFNPADFSNQPITAGVNDPYSNPIIVSVAETGGSGFMHLTVNGTDVGTSTTLTQSSQTLGVKYLSGGTPGYFATVTLSATGVSPASFNVAPMYVTSTSPYYSAGVLAFTGTSESAVLSISEAAGSNTYALSESPCASSYAVGSVTGSGATGSVTVTSGSSVAGGGCSIGVTDSANTALTLAYTQNSTNTGVQIGGITEYSTPVKYPNLIVAGTDGNLYVGATTSDASTLTGSTIWVYNTSGGEVGWSNPLANDPVSMAAGPDANLWFVASNGTVFTYNLANGVGSFIPSSPSATKLVAIADGPDGNMWAVDNSLNTVFEFPPYLASGPTYNIGLAPTLIASSAVDNAAWVVAPGVSSTLVRIAPGGSPVDATIPNASVGPAAITTDPAGNVWIAEQTENQIDKYTPGTSTWTQYPIGQSDGPVGIAVGPDGNIWFTAPSTNSIGMFNVTTHAFSHYPIPTTGASPAGITLGSDGRMWFTESLVEKIGAITP
jgi:streptogramin lyase